MKQHPKAEALVDWLNFLEFFMKARDKMVLIALAGGVEGESVWERRGWRKRAL